MDTLWMASEHDQALAHKLAEEAGISETVALILLNRGITTAADARAFLAPSLDNLHDPTLLPDMEQGVSRLARALDAGEKVLVHGDYDVDGVTSAALLVRALSRLGANVVHRVPHRKREGYDIKPWTADEAHAEGVSLIITADCGVTACETIERAQSLGIDIIVTDHHEPGEELPKAVAVINPRRKDSAYPFPELAGVGVAMKFAQALVRRLGYNDRKFLEKYLDLAALGTIADVMPLVDENRIIARFGLEAIGNSRKIGLQAMLKRAGLAGRRITSHTVGFVLGPRINAVGRMDDAAIALQLLITNDEAEAEELVEVLEQHNQNRQEVQSKIFDEAIAQLEQRDLESLRAIVLSGEDWNSGVVGIVANKVVEQFGRPAILLSVDPKSGLASGSARSIECFNMIDALGECRDLLIRAGGHAFAAGLSLKTDRLSEFESKLNELAFRLISPEDLVPRIAIDCQLDPQEVSWELLKDIRRLEPFGAGNPEPVFATSGLEVTESRRVGSDGSHLKLRVLGRSGEQMHCIAFGQGDMDSTAQVGRLVDLCYNIRSNHYNGYDTLQLMVKDLRAEL
ncbi:MAG: single-stranded-DNA-specific exonuclease RecJ [Armatimonadetes bacterium]|nr:single-stranded-DNA-specific exonuclease RecJ [Armatimonadota bacterium]